MLLKRISIKLKTRFMMKHQTKPKTFKNKLTEVIHKNQLPTVIIKVKKKEIELQKKVKS